MARGSWHDAELTDEADDRQGIAPDLNLPDAVQSGTFMAAMIFVGVSGVTLLRKPTRSNRLLLKVILTLQMLIAVVIGVAVALLEPHPFLIVWATSIALCCCMAFLTFAKVAGDEV